MNKYPILSPHQFTKSIKHAKVYGKTVRACRMVLVEGMTLGQAAEKAKLDKAGLSRMLKKIPTDFCNCCKQPIMK